MAAAESVVIVTGAGSGIGFKCAELLLARGNRVHAWDVQEGRLGALPQDRLTFRRVDVADGDAVFEAASRVEAAEGRINGLVACAAIFHASPFLDLTDALWDETFAVNLEGALSCAQAVLPAMRRQRRGSIVFFSSILARSGAVNGAHYAATKGGILGLARSLALEVGRDNVRVNVVSPGVTDTAQPRGNMSEEQLFGRAKFIPLGRIGEPAEMAEAAAFLLSEDASFVTGQDIRITGGAHLF